MRESWIPVGEITRTHGLKGELKFRPGISDPEILQDFKNACIVDPQGQEIFLQVASIRGRHSRLIIKFKGWNTIEAVQPLVGAKVSMARSDFSKLPGEEYYWFEIEGIAVADEKGRPCGHITEIIQTGSNDVYVVRDGEREWLLPMIDSVVKNIDLEAGKLIFRNVEGLIEESSD